MKAGSAPTSTCSFLGLANDPIANAGLPWPEHRCFATDKPLKIARERQGLSCLTASHATCPRFILGQGIRQAIVADQAPAALVPSRPTRQVVSNAPKPPSPGMGFMLRVALVAAVAVLIITLDFAFFHTVGGDFARSESLVTPGPSFTTYTFGAPTRTPVPPTSIQPASGTGATSPVIQPSAPSSLNQAVQPQYSTPGQAPDASLASLGRPSAPIPTPTAAPPTQPALQARITMQPANGPVGTAVTIMGAGWLPNNQVVVRWGMAPNETGMTEFAGASTNAAGAFSANVRIPAGVSGTVYISARQGDRAAYVPFVISQ